MQIASGLAELEGGEAYVVHAWSAPGEELLSTEGQVPLSEVIEYVLNLREEDRKAVWGRSSAPASQAC